MTVPGGCPSQGCHRYLLGSLAAPFCFIRHLLHTHLLLMGLNDSIDNTFVNPFAPGDFAEKRVLKLVEWFSGLCRAIKS